MNDSDIIWFRDDAHLGSTKSFHPVPDQFQRQTSMCYINNVQWHNPWVDHQVILAWNFRVEFSIRFQIRSSLPTAFEISLPGLHACACEMAVREIVGISPKCTRANPRQPCLTKKNYVHDMELNWCGLVKGLACLRKCGQTLYPTSGHI